MRRDGGHFGGDHPAQGVARQDRILQAQQIDQVGCVQGEVEHVAQLAALLGLAIAREERRIEVIALG